ncbi:MAG: alpha/beta fold hydrolase [Patescibacteria group bacterium]
MTQEKVTFQTTDGVTIIGDWDAVTGAKKAVLLLHMMPAVRGSWSPLSAELKKNNFATLAIDLRGHGESTQQGEKKLDYTKFNDIEHQASRLDVDTAINFLKTKGFAEENILIVGASIGANLVADAMYRYVKIGHGVLLSPGLDYRAIRTEPAVKQLTTDQKIWIVSSEGDKYSADSTVKLQQTKPDNITISMVEGSDHGTNMFASQKTLIQDIVKFLAF